MQAHEYLQAGEDLFVETTTRRGSACFDLIDRLRPASRTKGFYAYELRQAPVGCLEAAVPETQMSLHVSSRGKFGELRLKHLLRTA